MLITSVAIALVLGKTISQIRPLMLIHDNENREGRMVWFTLAIQATWHTRKVHISPSLNHTPFLYFRYWGCVRWTLSGSAINLGHLPSTATCSFFCTWEYCRLWVSSLPSRQGKWRYLFSMTQNMLQHWCISQVLSLWLLFLSNSCLKHTSIPAMGYSPEGLCF